MTDLLPRRPAPPLVVPTTAGETWRLAERTPTAFSMIVVYRGLHCPICSGYLQDLASKLDAFVERGVEVLAVSTDTAERADAAGRDWKLGGLSIGYGLDLGTARAWGLFISAGVGTTSTGVAEPERFAEPGLFVVAPDHTLYFASIQSMPFARPSFADVLKAIDFVRDRGYPARGEVARAA